MKNSAFDNVMTALADPTRRRILVRLLRTDARVTDLARPFSISLNAVSKHIRILERARLVQRRKEGRSHIIAVVPGPLDDVLRWIEEARQMWQGAPGGSGPEQGRVRHKVVKYQRVRGRAEEERPSLERPG